jgi:hypothetical protein
VPLVPPRRHGWREHYKKTLEGSFRRLDDLLNELMGRRRTRESSNGTNDNHNHQ